MFVEDLTDARRHEQEMKVKEATIREVHHRVKNNLQTIASLLRIQSRRSSTAEGRRSLSEAVERISSMAVVHEMLAGSTEECVDFHDAAATVVDMVRQSLAQPGAEIDVSVEGSTGDPRVDGDVARARDRRARAQRDRARARRSGAPPRHRHDARLPGCSSILTVRDDGVGLPEGFEPRSAHLGLAIVKTVVEDDLRGTLTFSGGRGTTVTIRVPLVEAGEPTHKGTTKE